MSTINYRENILNNDTDIPQTSSRYVLTPVEQIYRKVLKINDNTLHQYMPEDAEERLVSVLSLLTEREQVVVHKRYYDGMTYEQIGKTEKLTRERIRQILDDAFLKLRRSDSLQTMIQGSLYDYKRNVLLQDLQRKKEKLDAVKMELEEIQEKLDECSKQISEYSPMWFKDGCETKDEQKEKYEWLHIADLDLSNRSYNSLRRAGIKTVYDLMQLDIETLLKIRNLGKRSVQEIVLAMDQRYGFRFPIAD